ncbi:MAG TPA: IPT/TIG domain-containing protein [Pyrinomonadaceae bacterium]
MALFEGKTPAERNKMIAAIALPVLALIFVYNMFSGPSKPAPATTTGGNANTKSGTQRLSTAQQRAPGAADVEVPLNDVVPIVCCPEPSNVGDAGRNIFAFYVKPPPPPTPEPLVPTPTPAPPPPLMLAGLTPQSVFARQSGFTLQVSGDKFVSGARIYVGGQELQTQYKSTQQLSATVPASLITSPGARPVQVKTPDGSLYSNEASLNVMQPPAPTYTYIGFLKRARPSANTAVLKDPKGELYSVRQGDIVEGRFRVSDISERGVEVVDKDLNIKHTMPFVDARGTTGVPGRAPGSIQPPPPDPEGGGEEEP